MQPSKGRGGVLITGKSPVATFCLQGFNLPGKTKSPSLCCYGNSLVSAEDALQEAAWEWSWLSFQWGRGLWKRNLVSNSDSYSCWEKSPILWSWNPGSKKKSHGLRFTICACEVGLSIQGSLTTQPHSCSSFPRKRSWYPFLEEASDVTRSGLLYWRFGCKRLERQPQVSCMWLRCFSALRLTPCLWTKISNDCCLLIHVYLVLFHR